MRMFRKNVVQKFIQTVGIENEIDEMMRPVLIIQRIFGQHNLDPNWTWWRFCPYHLALIILVVYVVIGTLDVLKSTNDVTLIAEAWFTLIITFMFQIKYLLFINKTSVFRKVYVELKTTLYETIKNESVARLRAVLNLTRMVFYGVFGAVHLPVVAYFFRALWFYFKNEYVTVSKSTATLMPMETPYYEIESILHITFMFHAAFTLAMTDMHLMLQMFVFCCSCDSSGKILAVEQKRSDENRMEYAIRLNEALRRFYKVHVKQTEFLNNLNSFLRWLALVPLITVTLCTCILFLQMSKGINWTFFSNIIPLITELFAFNWLGELVKDKVKKWNMALLAFDWINLGKQDKKAYYIIVCYMNKDFGIKTAGPELSLITMTNVLKCSYQAFTVLQTMEE